MNSWTFSEFEELEYAVNKLNKSADPIGITVEDPRCGVHHLKLWLLQVINAMVDLETIPECINLATVTLVHKGSGKDPLDYRGIISYISDCQIIGITNIDEAGAILVRTRLSSCQSVWILQENIMC